MRRNVRITAVVEKDFLIHNYGGFPQELLLTAGL